MRTTRRTVLGWLLAAAICPPKFQPSPTTCSYPAQFWSQEYVPYGSYREKALALFPDVPSQFFTKILPNLKKGDEEITFEWRLPNE